MGGFLRTGISLAKTTLSAYLEDDALSKGAAIAFYIITSLAPVILLTLSLAGLILGRDAAQSSIVAEVASTMGSQAADVLTAVISEAAKPQQGVFAALVGVVVFIVTLSGAFLEVQSALNTIWKARPAPTTVTRFLRARAIGIGLVGALALVLVISLTVSAFLTSMGEKVAFVFPFSNLILPTLNFLVSLAVLALLFSAIYKNRAGSQDRMARRDYWRLRHGTVVHSRNICHRMLSRLGQRRVRLWCRRRTFDNDALGLLHHPNVSARRRIYESLCESPRKQKSSGRSDEQPEA